MVVTTLRHAQNAANRYGLNLPINAWNVVLIGIDVQINKWFAASDSVTMTYGRTRMVSLSALQNKTEQRVATEHSICRFAYGKSTVRAR